MPKLDLSSTDARKDRSRAAQLFAAHPQLFVSDMDASCRFFVSKLGFTVKFQYGQPPFYALVQREGACLNLRYVAAPVFNRAVGPDLLSASIPVANVNGLYAEYASLGVPLYQGLQEQPWGAEDFIVEDPDGNLIHFAESLEPDGAE